jgi:hypothetical protein
VPEDVALTGLASPSGQDVACGDILDWAEIHTSAGIIRPATGQNVAETLTRRGWLPVTGPDRCRGVNDDHG